MAKKKRRLRLRPTLYRDLLSLVGLGVLIYAAFALAPLAARAFQSPANGPTAAGGAAPEEGLAPTGLFAGTQDVPILMYHDVTARPAVYFDVSTAEFRAQLQRLKKAGANVIPLADLYEHFQTGKELPPRAVVLTFDDGYVGQFTDAYPVLKEFNYPATYFVPTGTVGIKTSRDHMTWSQLQELDKGGLVSIQAHTISHPDDLRKLKDTSLAKELKDSKRVLEEKLGHKIRFLAYPVGNADARVAKVAREAGYEMAFTMGPGWANSPTDTFFVPRFIESRLGEITGRLASGDLTYPFRSRVLDIQPSDLDTGLIEDEEGKGEVRLRWVRGGVMAGARVGEREAPAAPDADPIANPVAANSPGNAPGNGPGNGPDANAPAASDPAANGPATNAPANSPADGSPANGPITDSGSAGNPAPELNINDVPARQFVPWYLSRAGATAGLNGTFFSDARVNSAGAGIVGPILSRFGPGFAPGLPGDRDRIKGRPLVLMSPRRMAFLPFQPHLALDEAGVHRLMPEATDCFVAGVWLVHQGKAVSKEQMESFGLTNSFDFRPRALMGIDKEGRPFLGASASGNPSDRVAETLEKLGLEECVLLDSGFSTSLVLGNSVLVSGYVRENIPVRPVPHALMLFPYDATAGQEVLAVRYLEGPQDVPTLREMERRFPARVTAEDLKPPFDREAPGNRPHRRRRRR